MESAQVKRLKLNATNIKTVLISGNRSLKKLRSEENNLIIKQKQKIKIKRKEAVVEGKPLPGSGLVKGIGSKITAPARGLFDRVKDFLGTVLIGILINNIPKIIERIKKFLKDNEGIINIIKNVISGTGVALQTLINLFKPLFGTEEDLKEERKGVNEKLSLLGIEIDSAEKLLGEVTGKLKGEFDYESQTPEEIVENVRNEVVITRTDPVIYRQRMVKFRELKGKNLGTGETINLPGIGSFESRSANPIGKFFQLSRDEDKYFDPDGLEITQSQFMKRYDALQNSGKIDDVLKGYSQGGTIGSNLKLGSPRLKTASKSLGSFSRFRNNVLAQSSILKTQEENNNIFETIVDNFKKLIGISEELEGPPSLPPIGDSGDGRDNVEGVIASSSTERNLAAFLAFLEGGRGQTGADALQVMLNRASQNFSGYGGLIGQITAQNQFSPYAAAIYDKPTGDDAADRYYGAIRNKLGSTPRERIERLKEIGTGPNALQNLARVFGKGPGAVRAASDLLKDFELDGPLAKSSRGFIKGRTSFRGYDPSRFGVKDAIRRRSGGNYFFDDSSSVGKLDEVSRDNPLVASFKKVGEEVSKSKPGDGSKHVYPGGVGTVVRGKNWIGTSEDKFFDPSGQPITGFEFYDRLRKVLKDNRLEYLIPPNLTPEQQRNQFMPVSNISRIEPLNQSFDDSGGEPQVAMVMMTQPMIVPRTQTRTVVRTQKQLITVNSGSSTSDSRRRLV
jgi:hypothetical protein